MGSSGLNALISMPYYSHHEAHAITTARGHSHSNRRESDHSHSSWRGSGHTHSSWPESGYGQSSRLESGYGQSSRLESLSLSGLSLNGGHSSRQESGHRYSSRPERMSDSGRLVNCMVEMLQTPMSRETTKDNYVFVLDISCELEAGWRKHHRSGRGIMPQRMRDSGHGHVH